MDFQELAEKLIRAKTKTARKKLLENVPEVDFLKLAYALKDTYYRSWSAEPDKVENALNTLKLLLEKTSDDEISALTEWVAGIYSLTKGKMEATIEHLDRAAGIFNQINKEYEAANTQVAKLIALAMLGRYEQAIECGENTLEILEKFGDELTMGKIEKNLGNLVARRELNWDAEKYYLSAHRRFRKIENIEELAMCENSLANTYAELNDFRRAEKFYDQALAKARKAGMAVTEAEIEASLGNLALFRGRLGEALRFLELSRRKYETLKMPHQTAIADLEIADIYLELNLAEEAFSIYKKVADELSRLKLQGEEARARANFSRAAVVLQKTEAAKRQLKKAEKLYISEKNEVGRAIVKIMQAKLAISQKNYREALNFAKQAEKLLADSSNFRQQLTAQWLHGEALRNLNKNAKAEDLLEKTFAEAVQQEQPVLAQAAQTSLGKLFAARKNYRKAENHFKKAVNTIETLRAPLPAEEFRMAFLADKLAPFENLAKVYLAENKTEKAFLTIEKARARSLTETLQSLEEENQNLENEKLENSPQNKELAEKLLSLREELNWFYSRLNRADEPEIAGLHREAKKREKQIADVMRQIESVKSGGAEVGANRANLSESTGGSINLKQLQQ
ncbi:MAG TPA: hypothetical protein VK892_15240, partial [Pyrinomonadaceae bacterium]|nr:hypothetical protein [Pyrinomonadaceae bacterium]